MKDKLLLFTHNNDITKVTKAVTILIYFLSMADNAKHTLDFAFLWFWGREEEKRGGE